MGFGSNIPGGGRPGLEPSNLWKLCHHDRGGPAIKRTDYAVLMMAGLIRRQLHRMRRRGRDDEQWMMEVVKKVAP